MRHVRGILFLDYVRMLRRSGSQKLAQYLQPSDLELLGQQVDLGAWYPMETFERFGLAILGEVVGGEVDSVRLWGRSQIPPILSFFPELRAEGDPRDTIIRFSNLLGSLFDYPAVTLEGVSDTAASVRIAYGMGPVAEEAASWQTLGFFEALVEESKGEQVHSSFVRMSWKDPKQSTLVAINWRRPGSGVASGGEKPRLLLVDDEPLVLIALGRLLQPTAQVTTASNYAEAVKALDSAAFDVVVSDFNLGEGPDGLAVLREVARRTPHVGRVLHTSSVPPEAAEAVSSGAVHAVAEKPVSAGELKRLVAEIRGPKHS